MEVLRVSFDDALVSRTTAPRSTLIVYADRLKESTRDPRLMPAQGVEQSRHGLGLEVDIYIEVVDHSFHHEQ